MLFKYLFTVFWIWVHPFYLSLTEIRFNSTDSSIEVAQRVFWDDLEVALAKKYQVKVDFLNPKNPQELEKMIAAYLLEMNEIHINKQKVKLSYLRYEIEEDTAWLYMKGNNIATPQTVKIKNSILIHQFATQQNIINFYRGENLKSTITYKDNEWGELVFN